MTTVSWNDLKKAAGEAGFDPVPAGEYDVVVDSATVKPTSDGRKSQIATQFKIENGPHAGKKIFNNFVLSPDNPNALAFFFRHMSALGLNDAYFTANPSLERVAADLTGRRCRVTVSIREWNDTQRNQVDTIKPPASGPAQVAPSPAATAGLPGVPATGSPVPVTPSAPAVPIAPQVPAVPTVPAVTPPAPVTVTAPPAPAGLGTDDDLPF